MYIYTYTSKVKDNPYIIPTPREQKPGKTAGGLTAIREHSRRIQKPLPLPQWEHAADKQTYPHISTHINHLILNIFLNMVQIINTKLRLIRYYIYLI